MWLALRFPHWALDSRGDAAAAGMLLVVEPRDGRRVVVAAGPEALRQGARPGMVLADARIHAPAAQVCERIPASEAAALERLAGWAWRYSSQIHIAPAADAVACTRLILEIGASLRLFGGRRRLLGVVRDDLARLGYRYRAGVGETPEAALAFARASRSQRRHGLAGLPLGCLDLAPRTAASLAASGLRRAGEVLGLPPGALLRRYGPDTLAYLERLRGHRPHALPLYRLPEYYRTRHELTGAVETTRGLIFVLRRALAELAAFLLGADAAIQRLRLTLSHDGQPATVLTLRLASPTRTADHLERVVNDRLTRVTLAAPVLEIGLASDRLRRFEHVQNKLWQDANQTGTDHWPAVLDRLRARLGHDAVTWLAAPADHRPERASGNCDRPPVSDSTTGPPRPLWLLDEPTPIRQPLELIAGPERIESGWWDEHGIRRDYFRALDARGRLLWIYRDLDAAPHATPPVYYLHGLFG